MTSIGKLALTAAVVLTALALAPTGVLAAEERRSVAQTPASVPVYKPPLRGAPGGRVGGGTRGAGAEPLTVLALAPGHIGLTLHEAPPLYWFIPRPTSAPVEVTLIEAGATRPLLEARVPSPVEPGVYRIRLAEHGVRLKPGVQYQWWVAVVLDPNARSKDVLSGGGIERVETPEPLRKRLREARRTEAPYLYAEGGIWYDAIAAISELIDAEPKNPVLRNQRAALLEQIGLAEPASFDRRVH